MPSLQHAPAILLTVACLALTSVHPERASAQATSAIATQLGSTLAPSQPEELFVGTSITCTLTDPAKLAALGATGLHAGARVSVVRTSQEKVRVEVDELEPVPLTKRLTLKLDSQGRLSALAP